MANRHAAPRPLKRYSPRESPRIHSSGAALIAAHQSVYSLFLASGEEGALSACGFPEIRFGLLKSNYRLPGL
jgi:hypothetical protein